MTIQLASPAHAGVDLEWVPTGLMSVDPKYQRELNHARIDRMADNFDLRAAGVVYAVRKGRQYNLIDGQHRWAAAVKAGVEELACLTYANMTTAEAARLFVMFNRDRAQAHITQVFRARVAEGDPVALRLQSIVNSVGYKVGLGSGNFQAVGTLERLHGVIGPIALQAILSVISQAWSNDRVAGTDANVIRAVGAVYCHYSASAIDWDRMRSALAATTRRDLVVDAQRRRTTVSVHGIMAQLAMLIVDLYNAQSRSNRLQVPATPAVFSAAIRGYRHKDLVGSQLLGPTP